MERLRYARVSSCIFFFQSNQTIFDANGISHIFSRIGATWAATAFEFARRHGVQRRVHAAKPTFSAPLLFVYLNPVVNRLFRVETRTDVVIYGIVLERKTRETHTRAPHMLRIKRHDSLLTFFFFFNEYPASTRLTAGPRSARTSKATDSQVIERKTFYFKF